MKVPKVRGTTLRSDAPPPYPFNCITSPRHPAACIQSTVVC